MLVKKRVFTGALKRLNRERQRVERIERLGSQSAIAARALELKRANRVQHHPTAGRAGNDGMSAQPNELWRGGTPRSEMGRVSQFVKDAQARRDAR